MAAEKRDSKNEVTVKFKQLTEEHTKFTFHKNGRLEANGGVSTTTLDGIEFHSNVEGQESYSPTGKSITMLKSVMKNSVPPEATVFLSIDKNAFGMGAVFVVAQWVVAGRGRGAPTHERHEFMIDAGIN